MCVSGPSSDVHTSYTHFVYMVYSILLAFYVGDEYLDNTHILVSIEKLYTQVPAVDWSINSHIMMYCNDTHGFCIVC